MIRTARARRLPVAPDWSEMPERWNDPHQGKAKGKNIVARLLGAVVKGGNGKKPPGGKGGNAAKKSTKR